MTLLARARAAAADDAGATLDQLEVSIRALRDVLELEGRSHRQTTGGGDA